MLLQPSSLNGMRTKHSETFIVHPEVGHMQNGEDGTGTFTPTWSWTLPSRQTVVLIDVKLQAQSGILCRVAATTD